MCIIAFVSRPRGYASHNLVSFQLPCRDTPSIPRGMLPERIFLGCGTKEYSATRDHERDDVDNLLLHYYKVCLHSRHPISHSIDTL